MGASISVRCGLAGASGRGRRGTGCAGSRVCSPVALGHLSVALALGLGVVGGGVGDADGGAAAATRVPAAGRAPRITEATRWSAVS